MSLPKDRSIADAFKREKKELRRFAEMIQGMELKGYALPKRPNYDQGGLESGIHGFFPMMGIPCYAETCLPKDRPTIFCAHSEKFDEFEIRLEEAVNSNRPYLITNSSVKGKQGIPKVIQELSAEVAMKSPPCIAVRGNIHLLRFDSPWDLSRLPELDQLRNHLLKPWKLEMDAPFGVSLTLLEDSTKKIEVLQNFNDVPVKVRLCYGDDIERIKTVSLPDDSAATIFSGEQKNEFVITLAPRSLLTVSTRAVTAN